MVRPFDWRTILDTGQHVFDRAAAPIVDKAIAGFNGAIINYGRTGAGKTHTMYGEVDLDDAKGFAPRALERMLAFVAKQKPVFEGN